MLHNWFYHARHIVRIKLVRFKFQTKTTSKFRDLKKETLLKFWLFFFAAGPDRIRKLYLNKAQRKIKV